MLYGVLILVPSVMKFSRIVSPVLKFSTLIDDASVL